MSGWSMGPGVEERVHEREAIELALVGGTGAILEGVPDRAHAPDVVRHPGRGAIEGHREPALDVGAHLGADPEVEPATAPALEVPRGLGHREGAAGERDRDVGADVHPPGRSPPRGRGAGTGCESASNVHTQSKPMRSKRSACSPIRSKGTSRIWVSIFISSSPSPSLRSSGLLARTARNPERAQGIAGPSPCRGAQAGGPRIRPARMRSGPTARASRGYFAMGPTRMQGWRRVKRSGEVR